MYLYYFKENNDIIATKPDFSCRILRLCIWFTFANKDQIFNNFLYAIFSHFYLKYLLQQVEFFSIQSYNTL